MACIYDLMKFIHAGRFLLGRVLGKIYTFYFEMKFGTPVDNAILYIRHIAHTICCRQFTGSCAELRKRVKKKQKQCKIYI